MTRKASRVSCVTSAHAHSERTKKRAPQARFDNKPWGLTVLQSRNALFNRGMR